jgi:hypothetical protein
MTRMISIWKTSRITSSVTRCAPLCCCMPHALCIQRRTSPVHAHRGLLRFGGDEGGHRTHASSRVLPHLALLCCPFLTFPLIVHALTLLPPDIVSAERHAIHVGRGRGRARRALVGTVPLKSLVVY